MIGRLNHVAIAVPDLAAAAAQYRYTLGATVGAPQAEPEHGVTVVFVELPNTKIELLQPLGEASPIAGFLAKNPAIRSNTSVCLKVVDPAVGKLSGEAQAAFVKAIAAALEKEGVAYDIDSYRDAPAGLRIWCGSTVERADVEALTAWLDWAFAKSKGALSKAA